MIDDLADDLAVFGAPKELVESLKPNEPDNFKVWRANWTTVRIFVDLATQWVFAGMGDRIGLNYQSADLMLDMYAVKIKRRRRQVFQDLRIMEMAALTVWRDRTERERKNGR